MCSFEHSCSLEWCFARVISLWDIISFHVSWGEYLHISIEIVSHIGRPNKIRAGDAFVSGSIEFLWSVIPFGIYQHPVKQLQIYCPIRITPSTVHRLVTKWWNGCRSIVSILQSSGKPFSISLMRFTNIGSEVVVPCNNCEIGIQGSCCDRDCGYVISYQAVSTHHYNRLRSYQHTCSTSASTLILSSTDQSIAKHAILLGSNRQTSAFICPMECSWRFQHSMKWFHLFCHGECICSLVN